MLLLLQPQERTGVPAQEGIPAGLGRRLTGPGCQIPQSLVRPINALAHRSVQNMRETYGYRTFRITELSLYHVLGKLPEPQLAHSFF